MTRKIALTIAAAASAAGLSSGFAQQEGDFAASRTEWGQPDLQGVWNFSSNTPMQRPERFGNQEFLTPEQVEQEQARIARMQAAADAAAAQRVVDPDAPPVTSNPGGYNDFWVESAGIGENVRTSHIVYPLNGRLPPRVEGVSVQRGGLGPDIPGERPVRYAVGGIGKDGPEDRGLSERCIVGFNSGPPFNPSLYNNNVQIFQGKDTAVIFTEMIHDARIVPLYDGPESLPAIDDDLRLWSGDSRGYFDGDTLVVETRNFTDLTVSYSAFGNARDKVLTERFTRLGYDTMNYEWTIDDPSTFTDKITAVVPMTKVAGQLYEYACHEGNYGMTNILRGERMTEQRAAGGESSR
jgi:hypothetical protein